jgi:hypothetical protein
MERLPTELAITEQIRHFKSIKLKCRHAVWKKGE